MDLYNEIIQMKHIQEESLSILKELRNNGVVGNKDKVYDLTDLEEKLHVSRRTLFKWKSEGRMIFAQAGKKLYVTDAEFRRFLETNKLN